MRTCEAIWLQFIERLSTAATEPAQNFEWANG